ncbi:uncharacterized protein G2W53_023563 [Senna tora]|uniref:Uncharacterized protein n=1 Tax=Senna tora TaxID=362788 RepID=A0A834T9B6_9FABA|nr:uncharacterized protein G2W53_023563 [Senna tora]
MVVRQESLPKIEGLMWRKQDPYLNGEGRQLESGVGLSAQH